MIRSLRGSLQTRKTFRRALLGAGSSLVLAALNSGSQGASTPILCADDFGRANFTCGFGATTQFLGADQSSATAVGHDTQAVIDGTSLGANAQSWQHGDTAIGSSAFSNSEVLVAGTPTAVNAGPANTVVGSSAKAGGPLDDTTGGGNIGATAIGAEAQAGIAAVGTTPFATAVG